MGRASPSPLRGTSRSAKPKAITRSPGVGRLRRMSKGRNGVRPCAVGERQMRRAASSVRLSIRFSNGG
jgi:hypothetical protein